MNSDNNSDNKELLIDNALDQCQFNFMKLNLIEEHYQLIVDFKCSTKKHKKIVNYIMAHERRHIDNLKNKVFIVKYFIENNLNKHNDDAVFNKDLNKIQLFNNKILKKYKIIILNLINVYIQIHES